jgi:formylmethanofuran dehydrogenase subunit E
MAGIDDRVRGFLEVWNRRKAGELPAPDPTVRCSRCGVVFIGDERVEFTSTEIACPGCRGSTQGE